MFLFDSYIMQSDIDLKDTEMKTMMLTFVHFLFIARDITLMLVAPAYPVLRLEFLYQQGVKIDFVYQRE